MYLCLHVVNLNKVTSVDVDKEYKEVILNLYISLEESND